MKSRWHRDGPELPVEFARISKDCRLTLVIHESVQPVKTYWALSAYENMKAAKKDLKNRENCKTDDVHSIEPNRADEIDRTDEVTKIVSAWLASKPDLGAAIWTGLPDNWQEKRCMGFNAEDAVIYFESLKPDSAASPDAHDRWRKACEYVQNAPAQIQTKVRSLLREKLNLADVQLSQTLFEE